MVATPLTQKRFVRRHEGTYGPGVDMTRANLYGAALAPGPATGVDGLWAVGDSTYPGIGVPAAAGSGFFTANSIVSVWKNLAMLYGAEDRKERVVMVESVRCSSDGYVEIVVVQCIERIDTSTRTTSTRGARRLSHAPLGARQQVGAPERDTPPECRP